MAERTFRLYDTLTRQIKPLVPQEPGHLRFYSCGPTVYSTAHIGNFRTFLSADLVVRTARALGWRVSYVSNITDVGHLTEDDVADASGDDRMVRALRSKEGQAFANIWDLADFYARQLVEDWRTLNLIEPTVRPRATQHMREQILAIEELVAKGHAYETPTGVYFAVDSFPGYGRLSGNTQENLRDAVRQVVLDENKRQQADFALWKKDDKHLMQWYSPWGWGFPGWHIECSVMARAYLGDTLDLHAGGEDLIFPHHECEIAQSESLTGKPFARHWMHTRFLLVDGEKMAKSKGNWYTVRGLIEQGADPMAIRYALISVPYGKPLNFTLQGLRDAAGNVERFRECERRIEATLGEAAWRSPGEPTAAFEEVVDEILDALCDDLNTSVAIAKALEGTKMILRESTLTPAQAHAAIWFLHRVNDLLGFVRPESEDPRARLRVREAGEPEIDGRPIGEWIEERARAKRERDYRRADEIRERLQAAGFELRDTPEGTTWVRRLA